MNEKIKAAEQIAIKAMCDKYRSEGGKAYTLGHCMRVMRLSGRIADSPELAEREIDRESMLIAAMFHDIGREMDSENHCEAGRDFVMKELAGILDGDQLEKVAEMVKFHNRPVNTETEIIHDADLIDRCGTNLIWRVLHLSAHHRRDQRQTLEWYEREKDAWQTRWEDWAIFEITKKEIKRRADFESEFFEEMLRELECELGE
jgi:putative nucleotidyltransferase with HDIG domain